MLDHLKLQRWWFYSEHWYICVSPTFLRCGSPGWGCNKDRRGLAGLPLRSAGCTLAVGSHNLARHRLFLDGQGPAPPLARTLSARRRSTALLHFRPLQVESQRCRNTSFTFGVDRHDDGTVTVGAGELPVGDAVLGLDCVDRLPWGPSATVIHSVAKTSAVSTQQHGNITRRQNTTALHNRSTINALDFYKPADLFTWTILRPSRKSHSADISDVPTDPSVEEHAILRNDKLM